MNHSWTSAASVGLLLLLALRLASSAETAPLRLPGENAALKASGLPGYAVAQQKCVICHSTDYIAYQPPAMTMKQWSAEVLKMKRLFGAPIDDEEIQPIAAYLATVYGDSRSVEGADPH